MNRRFLAGCAAILLTGFVLNEPMIYDNFTHPLVHGSWVPTVVGAVRMAVMCLVAFTLFVVLAGSAWVGIKLYEQYKAAQAKQFMQRDGSFAMQRVKNRDGSTTYFLPDNLYGPGCKILPDGTMVALGIEATPDQFANFRMKVEDKHRTQAAIPGDEVHLGGFLRRLAGALGGRSAGHTMVAPTAPMLRYAAGAYDKQPRRLVDSVAAPVHEEVEEPDGEDDVVMTLSDYANKEPFEIALGYNSDGPATWNMHDDPHFAVWGKSKTGKSRFSGLSIATQQAMKGYHVVVLDTEYGKDWGLLGNAIELVQVEPDTALSALNQVMIEYDNRTRELAQSGLSTIYHGGKGRWAPICLHLEEYGRLRAKMRGLGKSVVNAFDDHVAEIAQRGAAKGFHLSIYAQLPDDVPEMVSSNLVSQTYKQGSNHGNKVGYWHAHNLVNRGSVRQFAYEGIVFQAFMPEASELSSLLRNVRVPGQIVVEPLTQSARVIDGESTVVRDVGEKVASTDPVARMADKRQMIFEWRRRNPNGVQSQFRQWLDENGLYIARGYISDTWNKFDAQGA